MADSLAPESGGAGSASIDVPKFAISVDVPDAVVRGASKGTRCWVGIEVSDEVGLPAPWWWRRYPREGVDGNTCNSWKSKLASCNGSGHARLKYHQTSRELPLTAAGVELLINATLQLTLYSGEGDASQIIGSTRVPLFPLAQGAAVGGSFEVAATPTGDADQEHARAGASITVQVTASETLVQYGAGGRVLEVTGVSVAPAPSIWALVDPSVEPPDAGQEPPPPDPEKLAALAAHPEHNPHRFAVSISLPVDPQEVERGSSVDGRQALTVFGGRLVYAAAPSLGSTEDPHYQPSSEGKSAAADDPADGKKEETKDDGCDSKRAEGQTASTSPHTSYEWRIVWPSEACRHKVFLTKRALRSALSESKDGDFVGPATIHRLKGRPLEVDEPDALGGMLGVRPVSEDASSRGCAVFSLASLREPGVSEVCVSAELAPDVCSDESAFDETLAISNQRYDEATIALSEAGGELPGVAVGPGDVVDLGGGGGTGKKGKGGKGAKGKGKVPAEVAVVDPGVHPYERGVDDEYVPAAQISLRLRLDEPIFLRPPSPPQATLSAVSVAASAASVRPAVRSREVDILGLSASAEFRHAVSRVARDIVAEFVLLGGKSGPAATTMTSKQREATRAELLRSLQSGSRYITLKQMLRKSVVSLVKQRFRRSADSGDSGDADDRAKFTAALYSFLLSQVRIAVNNACGLGDTDDSGASHSNDGTSMPDALGDSSSLEDKLRKIRRVAEEAEFNEEFDRAERALLDCVALVDSVEQRHLATTQCEAWMSVAEFGFRRGEFPRATEALKEAVSRSPANPCAQLALAMALAHIGAHHRALKAVGHAIECLTTNGPGGISTNDTALANCVASIILERAGDDRGAGAALLAAVEAMGGDSCALPADAYLLFARYALALNMDGLADHAINLASRALFDTKPSVRRQVELLTMQAIQNKLRGDFSAAACSLSDAVRLEPSNSEAWGLLGEVELSRSSGQSDQRSDATAREALERAVEMWDNVSAADQLHPQVLVRLGRLYLIQAREGESKRGDIDATAAHKAKQILLRSARNSMWATAWLGAAEAALIVGERYEAEAALCEANVRDEGNPHVWGWMALLAATATPPRQEEFDRAVRQALYHDLRDAHLLRSIGVAGLALGSVHIDIASQALKRASFLGDDEAAEVLAAGVQ